MTEAAPINSGNLKTLKRDSLLRNLFIVFGCLLGMGLSIFLFRVDLENTTKKLEEKPIGSVYRVNRIIQRESSRFFLLDKLERQSPIYKGDLITSAALSELKINLTNGETLELFENTKVLMTVDNEKELGFELHEGEIHVQSMRSNIVIDMIQGAAGNSDVKITLDPRSYADIQASDGVRVKLFQGAAVITRGRDVRPLADGEIIRLDRDGELLPAAPAMMLWPRNGTRLHRSSLGAAPVHFQWSKSKDIKEVILEIAETRDFSALKGNWLTDDDSMEIELAEGNYYWRLYRPGVSAEADYGRLEINYTPGPVAISPANNATVTYSGDTPEISFFWSVSEEADAVLLEAADNPAMNRPRLRQLIKRTEKGYGSFLSSTLGPGEWHWRIYPVYPGGVSGAETLATPMGAGYWRIRPVNNDLVADDQPSPVNSFVLKKETEKSAGPERPPVAVAEPGFNPRLIFPPDNYSIETARTMDLYFSWRNPQAFSARLQIAERSDFAGRLILDEPVGGSYIQGPFLKPGTYYWRITGQGPEGPGNSPPTRLVVIPALAAARLESPWQNDRLRIEEGKPVVFAWEMLNYASYYNFKLFLDGRELPQAEISSLRNNSILVFFDTGTSGQFTWTVQGFTAESESDTARIGLISTGNFTINPQAGSLLSGQISWTRPRIANIQSYVGDVHSPITLLSPQLGISVPGIDALKNPLQAMWRTEEPIRNVQLIISRSPDPQGDPRAIVRDAGQFSATFPALSEGIWYWTIRGDTADQRGATPGDPFWINVLPIPQLSSPAPIQPEKNAIIDIAQLTRDRNVTFAWNEVPGANGYIFNLYRNGNPPALLVSNPPDNTQKFVLENLSILSDGAFVWQVEAVLKNDSGLIEQRGTIEQHTFFIEIEHSTDLNTSVQGTMYGH